MLICFIRPQLQRSALTFAADEFVSVVMYVSSWYSFRIYCIVFFASASAVAIAQHSASGELKMTLPPVRLIVAVAFSAYLLHNSSCASSRFHARHPFTHTVASGREFVVTCFIRRGLKLPDAHQVQHDTRQAIPVDVSWSRALTQLVVHQDAVPQRRAVVLSLVGNVLPTRKDVVLHLPTLFLSLGDRACWQDSNPPCSCPSDSDQHVDLM